MTVSWQVQRSAERPAACVRSQATVRRAIRRSPVPVSAWAQALGCSPRALYMLLEGSSRVLCGPLVDRAGQLLDALRNGRSRWRKVPTRGKPGHPTYWLDGERFTPSARAMVNYHVDFLHMRITREPSEADAPAPNIPQPPAHSHAGGMIGALLPGTEVVHDLHDPARRFNWNR